MNIKRIVKRIGLAVLTVLVVIGLFAGNLYWLNRELTNSTPGEVRAQFGEFLPGEDIKLQEVGGFKRHLAGWMGAVLPEFFALENLRHTRMFAMAYESDGLVISGIVLMPEGDGEFPVLVFNRGGNRDFGSLNLGIAVVLLAPIVQQGYAVVASNYRGGPGSEGADEFGGADLNDISNLVARLPAIPQVDESRMGMLGFSRGGMMTYLSLKRMEGIRTAVILSGATDLLRIRRDRPEMDEFVFSELIPGYAGRGEELLRERSALYWAEDLPREVPLLIVHGTVDDRVNFAEARQLADRLAELDHPYQFVTATGDGHPLRSHMLEVRGITHRWLDRYLRDGMPFDESQSEIVLQQKN